MVGTAHAAPDDRLTCEKCHGFYAVEVPEPGAQPRVRCNACGHIRELGAAPVPKTEDKGKWTVIGPDGKVMTFGSWERLVESGKPPPHVEEKKVSATTLLESTPPIAAPKLMLEDLESNPILPIRPSAKPENSAKLIAKVNAPVWAPAKDTKQPLDSGKAVDGDDDAAPLSLRDAIVDDPETSPLSLRDIIPQDDETSPLSLKDVTASDADSSDAHEVVSLDEVVLLTPESHPDVASNPHPPVRGVLRTLPPTRAKGDLAPPPTITVEERDTTSQAITTKVDLKNIATKADAKPAKKTDSKADAKPESAKKKPATDERKPVATARAAVAEETPQRSWLIPSVTVAIGAIAVWRLMAAPAKPDAPVTPAVVATATATATEATPTASAVETAPPPQQASTAAPETPSITPATTAAPETVAIATPTATAKVKVKAAPPTSTGDGDSPVAAAATEKKAAPTGDAPLSMSDLLDRAGSARRSGDLAGARELYEKVIRQNPSNVEANGGLGDVARAQGDLSGAKTSYERALAASPTYGPAQLGLADIEWDSGNHASAQRRYAQIVEQQGRRAPERARQRSTPSE